MGNRPEGRPPLRCRPSSFHTLPKLILCGSWWSNLGQSLSNHGSHVFYRRKIRSASRPGKQFNLVIDEEPLENACQVWSRIILLKYGCGQALKAQLLPSTSSVTVASPSKFQPPNSVIDAVPTTSDNLSISAASSSFTACSVLETTTTTSNTIPTTSQDTKETSKPRRKKNDLLKTIPTL
ncbi:uncharacterized protein TNCV_5125021 [Trichonephila clavipes]|nr:uncharacterized protein TNCV_5125021 [Trichonephila clavipes]